MLLQLLRFETRYQSKQRALPICALLLFFFGFFIGGIGQAPAQVDFNAPFQITYFTGNFSLLCVFVIMFFVVSGVLRDHKHKTEALIYSTSIRKHHFFWSRFLGTFLFSIIGFSLFLPGFVFGLSLSDLNPERIAPFQFQSYLWPFLVVIIPNIFICTSVLFSVSLLSKSNVATYASAILIYILYFVVGIYSNSPMFASSIPASPETMAIAALADPFAISTFFEYTQFWTPFEKSSLMFSFSGNYVWNRLLWIGFSFVVLGVTYGTFSFRKMAPKRKKELKTSPLKKIVGSYKPAKIKINIKTQWNAFWSSVRIDIAETFKSLPFIAIVFTLLIASVFELYARIFEGGSYNDSWYPYTNLVIEIVIEIVPLLNMILIVFYCGELVWKARDRKFNTILYATPTLNWVFFLSKLIALFALPLFLISTVIFICIVFQLANGFTAIDFKQYLLLFYHYGTPALIFSISGIFIQSILKNKYLGMGITGLVILFLATPLSGNIGIEHPMLRLGIMPQPIYSNMSGYSIQALAFHIYAIYWIAFGFILAVLSLKFWKRQLIESQTIKKYFYFKRWKVSETIALGSASIIFIVAGSILYTKIDKDRGYMNSNERMNYSEEYERKFKQYETLPKLHYTDIKTEVAIYPKDQKYTIAADYKLLNKNDVPITHIFLSERKILSELSVDNATLIFKDTVFGTYLFEFDTPILPKKTARLRYQLTKQSIPFKPDRSIVKNGSYIRHEVFEPSLWYNRGIEISDPQIRKKRGLPVRQKSEEKTGDRHLFTSQAGYGDVSYETIVSTSEDQMALAPGNLIKKWTKNGRNFYQYRYPDKHVPVIAYFSAKYHLKKHSCNGISVEFYYHPGHDINHETIKASTCETLSYCAENFGNYMFDHLRIAEIPSYFRFGGAAHPGLINMVEDNLYLIDIRNTGAFDLVSKRTAHEVAHQWWGMSLTPKNVPGAGIITEGFTKYTEAVVLERMHGIGALWELNRSSNGRYFSGRTFALTKEPPLYLESGENYLAYGKSGLILLSLRDLLGEEKLNSVLRTLMEKYSQNTEYEVHTLDFINELYKVTPQEFHQLVNEWMKEIIRYDVTVDKTTYQRLDDGTYEITATIAAKRFKTLPSGKEIEIGINEPIKIGLFNQHPKNIGKDDKILYLETHRIKENLTTIRMIVDELPKYIAVDPFLTRVDRNYVDNLKEIN